MSAETVATLPAPAPIWIYNNWSAYDELSDSVELTESLAMRELDEMLRLRAAGVRLDAYMMDAFWWAPDGAYRTWRRPSWPDGPDRWLDACAAHGIRPGLWLGTNTLTRLEPAAQWQSSLSASTELALYTGGFLSDFMTVLQHWYDRGVRLFKFDFADFNAAAQADRTIKAPAEIRALNTAAFRAALRAFRSRNSEAMFFAYNGFGGDMGSTASALPFRDPVDPRWLEVFDSLYCGDPRASDVPQTSFWRSVDIYSDHMTRRFEQCGIPLERIDSAGFMIGSTWTNYRRRTSGWKGSLMMMLARGSRVNFVYGNLELLDAADARWFAKLQRMFAPLRETGATRSFGGIPGNSEPHGFVTSGTAGALIAAVNPAQCVSIIRLPGLASAGRDEARILLRDAGFSPSLSGDVLRLGPGQLVLIGTGRYADEACDLGIQQDIRIPCSIEPLPTRFTNGDAALAIEALVMPPASGDLRIIMQQCDASGMPVRSFSPQSMREFFRIEASQDGRLLPVEIDYDKKIWSGLSWAAGEVRRQNIAPDRPIRIRLSSAATEPSLCLTGRVFRVEY